jgi:hypothetical protein
MPGLTQAKKIRFEFFFAEFISQKLFLKKIKIGKKIELAPSAAEGMLTRLFDPIPVVSVWIPTTARRSTTPSSSPVRASAL